LDTAEKGRTETKVIALKSTQVNKVCQVFAVSAPAGVTEVRYSNNLLGQGKQEAVKLDLGGKFAGAVVVLNSATARIEAVAGVSVGQEGGFPAVSAAAEKEGVLCRAMFTSVFDSLGKPWSQGEVNTMRFDAKTGALVSAF
jgi:xanthine/uracil/vitamin C permease (AzgA family)